MTQELLKGEVNKPTFETGQTVRIKTNTITENFYVEFGPVQYFCDATTTCYGLFFNFKAQTGVKPNFVGPNDICWIPFSSTDPRSRLDNCTGPDQSTLNLIHGCAPLGTHGWKLQHKADPPNGSNPRWEAWFRCSTQNDDSTHTTGWLKVFTHTDFDPGHGVHWDKGWPDMEEFGQRLVCTRTCIAKWRREGQMGYLETHANLLWQTADTADNWSSEIAYTVCRKDTSYKWNGERVGSGVPVEWHVVEDTPNHNYLCGPQ